MTKVEPKIALVTGATGFVGSHLVRRLVRDGWRVHVIVRPTSSLAHLNESTVDITVHRHDGTTEGMLAIIQKAQPEIVFHLASLFISEHQPKDVAPLIQSNLLFGTQLLEAMKQSGITCLVNTGTSWQHYHGETYNPVNLYAATKQAFDDMLRFYLETSELRVVTLKLFDTYGPDDSRPKLIPLLMKMARSGETLAMSAGEQLIDLVYIDDVVDAYVLAGLALFKEKENIREEYVVSSGRPLSLQELVRVYEAATGERLSIQWGGRAYRAREVMIPWQFGSLLPGWSPKISFDQGLRKIFKMHSKDSSK